MNVIQWLTSVKKPRSTFLIGLVVFYLLQYFSPNKIIFFASYYIAAFLFFISTKDIAKSLIYSLILSIFSDIGLAGSYFLLKPEGLNLGSGFSITPLTVIVVNLVALSIFRKIKYIRSADYIPIIFFLWLVIFSLFFPEQNILYGLFRLGEGILTYYLLRIYLDKKDFTQIYYLLISMFIFQAGLAVIQFLFSRNLGILTEAVNIGDPYGITADEERALFRVTGSFTHPNYLAAFLISVTPFIFEWPFSNLSNMLLTFFSAVSVILTFSRAALSIFILQIINRWFKNKSFFIRKILNLKITYTITVLLVLIYFFYPYYSPRLQSFSQDIRIKLAQEGFKIMADYPLTGVGLNMSVLYYLYNPATDLYQMVPPSGNYRFHNLFLELASETGLIGLGLFLFFLILAVRYYGISKQKGRPAFEYRIRKAGLISLISLTGISMFNPVLYSSVFRLYFLLTALILI